MFSELFFCFVACYLNFFAVLVRKGKFLQVACAFRVGVQLAQADFDSIDIAFYKGIKLPELFYV